MEKVERDPNPLLTLECTRRFKRRISETLSIPAANIPAATVQPHVKVEAEDRDESRKLGSDVCDAVSKISRKSKKSKKRHKKRPARESSDEPPAQSDQERSLEQQDLIIPVSPGLAIDRVSGDEAVEENDETPLKRETRGSNTCSCKR